MGNTYVEAVYQGVTGSYSASTSNIVTQVVNLVGTSTSLTSAPNPSVFGGSVVFTATVARTSGTGTPTGTVNFYTCTSATNCSPSPSTLLGSGTLSSGKATYSTSSLPVGNTYVEAVYQGVTGSYSQSTSTIITQVVNTIGTSTSLTSSPNPSTYGTSVTFTATVTPAQRGRDRNRHLLLLHHHRLHHQVDPRHRLCRHREQGDLPTSTLPVGTTIVEAVYGGSTTDSGSTSNTMSQVVNAIGTTTALTSSPNPSTYGTSVTFTATVTPA